MANKTIEKIINLLKLCDTDTLEAILVALEKIISATC